MDFLNLFEKRKLTSKTLFVIGNGFDRFQGVPSSYDSFKDFLERSAKGRDLLNLLESFIRKEDIWGHFEESLAYLDREMMMNSINDFLDEFDVPKDEHADNFSAADYFTAVDFAMSPVNIILQELPKFFIRWVRSLPLPKDNRALISILDPDARYLNFNYTETLEAVYGLKKESILYLHGDRRDKAFKPVLGHGRDPVEAFDEWYDANKDRSDLQDYRVVGKHHKILPNNNPTYLAYFSPVEEKAAWDSQVQHDAIMELARRIEDYYEESAKKTQDVLKKNEGFFSSLSEVDALVVIGHSLSDVDYPYFQKIHQTTPNAAWFISYHTPEDQPRIQAFSQRLSLSAEKVTIGHL